MRYLSIHTLSKHATAEYVPDGVTEADFVEALDGRQRLIFFAPRVGAPDQRQH